MKLSLRLITCLVVSISLVSFVMAINQVRAEKRGLRADLERRAEILTESLQETVEPALLQRNSATQLRRIVQRFGDREHLVGVASFEADGRPIAMSAKLASSATVPAAQFAESLTKDKGVGGYADVNGTPMYIYTLPLHRDGSVSGILATFHDSSYIEAQSLQIWREALWHGAAQVMLIVLITFLVIRSTVLGPIIRVSQWMRDLRTGKAGTPLRPASAEFLQPLTSEAANLGQSLAEARWAAKEEARLREAGDSLWTAERLRTGLKQRLRGNPLFVVSNREPYLHLRGVRGIEVQVPASGLVTALEPILCACDGTWIAQGSGDADRETVDASDCLRVPPEHPRYTLRRVWLTKQEEDGYYFGLANEGIWPLCHIAHTRPVFRAADWEQYRHVNEKFAEATLREIAKAEQPIVLIQDYHFALLPRLVKAARPDARVGIFWHIPWPNPEAFAICPWQQELVDGLLGADLIGFHIQAHCNNFLETADQAIECRIEWDHFSVQRNSHVTLVRPHPISVALGESPLPDETDTSRRDRASILEGLGPEALFLGVGVDRLDYTKGIVERFRGIERFLEKYPEYNNRFVFVQFGAPSRMGIKRYQDFAAEIATEAQRINARFQHERWKPIILFNRHHSHREIEPFYKAADVCLVTSLHDGMNLVAKEFVAARSDEDGVLVLSRFAGACRELRDALLVNPYDIEQLAEAIRQGLEMAPEERADRMRRMRRRVREHNVFRWAADLISEVAEIQLAATEPPENTEARFKGLAAQQSQES
jgi:trehalose 6-phosphate synthase